MDIVRPPSPAAIRIRRTGSTWTGAVLLALWALVSTANAGDPFASAMQTQLWFSPVALGGALLLTRGVRAARSGQRFDAADVTLSEALEVTLGELWNGGVATAYEGGSSTVELRDVRLVQVERHFDHQVAYGATMVTPMGDALFAVIEAPGPAGPRDTYRVVSLSPAAAGGWVRDLVAGAAQRYGGPDSHAGATLLRWADPLAARFAPPDVAYASDRLLALSTRQEETREPVSVRGPLVARQTVLAASVSIGTGAPLLVTPVLFPALLEDAIACALEQAEAALPETERSRLRLTSA